MWAMRAMWAVGAAAVVLGLAACGDARTPEPSRTAPASADAAPGAASAQPPAAQAAAPFRWAQTLAWSSDPTGVLVTLSEPWKDARNVLHYRLVRGGSPPGPPPAPDAADRSDIVVPARRIAVLAAVHTGFLEALGAAGRIVAVDARHHVYSPDVRAALAAGTVVEVGSGAGLNVERLLAARPDLVLVNAVGVSEYAAYERLRRAGIPVLVTAEWMEHHPLARAEWVRLVGLLVGEEARADSVFAAVEAAYVRTAERARGFTRRPTVLLGGPYRDQWFVAGGRSFMAHLIDDAGGEYLWRTDTTRGGVPLGFENVLVTARRAEVWLHPGVWKTLADGERQDARFREFDAFRQGAVFNSDARLHPDGANDYWESGTVHPDRVLQDLVTIFHGSGDSLFYYRRTPP